MTNRQCLDCIRAWHKEWARKRRLKLGMLPMNSPEMRARVVASKERARIKGLARIKKWHAENRERSKAASRRGAKLWAAANYAHVLAYNGARRATKRKATPGWGQDGIKALYAKGIATRMTVDHIIPLRGKNVCGLHVIDNLHLLTFSQNAAKKHRFPLPDHHPAEYAQYLKLSASASA